ncbi:tRNA (guanosine(37)-N1)-methyltransferase TrmD [Gimesia maris]|jgi:tRNA (guanine37-N1)-methyltransferase|uniref:tRNA (guanine-N(1)-)-methyltransferase n=1 Tax=Gimesia maris TaxID=122 RepID=A0A3D3R6I9_9PLAN|nr:tRNA (guanosine(37)-N1)-methyltransferase TrmD [Gimesia maris]MAC54037.1 tRNA (guanosine(37)-N1)-methyltransferase TrmD [Gimesia sp.]EDL62334.1 tRNA (Guanine-N(1))-methyltransferase [Gimesia maris DSM 8797]QDT79675.1 tRNA (guanine-N(1)-)-methyltransferase [Gimesia maris]QEG17273.1 tRNA (guanine-N(1)-)-methyltransferase [Gimesia maris]QGQ29630.1 tRNA (guanosine(37)-N1)-methyltransferase TrmD [Gimesia maris]|tara:strand:+ start:36081 stop:36782 length:702 start_codon:yes stop_codon:yes gene_type:complete
MRFDILTLFPELFDSYLEQGLLKRAIRNQLVEIQRWNFRDWATDKHASVDDRPYGGGPGMLIGCDTVFQCVEHVREVVPEPGKLIMLTPQGRTLNQSLAQELSKERQLTLLCGRYEGFDERIRIGLEPMEISAGDFITNGGEVPAMLIIETVIRLIPGVLGDESSAKYDSFSESGLLEYPQYTRPQNFRGMEVPEVLLSGNHQEIARWRHEQSLLRTRERRSDLLTESESNST